MNAFSFRRLRAVLLLAAFSLGVASQALAAVTVTVPARPAASPVKMIMHDSGGAMPCTACDQANHTGTASVCPAPLCWNTVAAPAQVVRVGFVHAVIFAPSPDAAPHGFAVRPEPPPPRLSAIA